MQLKLTSATNSTLNLTRSICLTIPPHINSKGLWGQYNRPEWWLKNSLPLLELQLVLFCLSMAIIRRLLKSFGVSKISSQIIAGLIFGSSWKQWDEKRYKLFTVQSQETLSVLMYFGYMLYLFVIALKMDVRMIAKTKKKAFVIGIPTFFGPLICGLYVGTLLLDELEMADRRKLSLFVSLHSMVSLPVIANLLSELKLVNSDLGRLGLSSALVGDMLSQLAILTGNMTRIYQRNAVRGILTLGGLFLLVLLVCFVFKPAALCIINRTPKGKPVSSKNIQGVICLVLLTAVLSVSLAQPAISGPYFLGLIIPDGSPLVISLVEKLDFFVSELFMPILIAMCALQADLSKIFVAFGTAFTKFNIVLAFVTFSVKVISSFLGSLYCNLPVEDSLALSFMMSNKGVVELVFSIVLSAYNILSDELLVWLTVIVLIVATFVPYPVKYLYDPSRKYACYQKRNIMNLTHNSELRVLACVHKNEDTHGIIHLLNLSCPTEQNPLAVYVLHIIELVGRITPIFISHKIQNKALNDESYSENVVLSFDHFQSDNDGTVYVECFTTITPHKFMHDDICKLALDKATSLIILPFHQTWTGNGLIDRDDNSIRTLNCSVLERAPCSVGIFADRGHLGSLTAAMASTGVICKYSVCVIYLGGSDDREAISYVKRLAKDWRVELTVLRLTSPKEEWLSNNWEKMLDSETLKHFKMNCFGDGRVRYIEEVCDDGPQTALRVRKIVNEYDLIIVGRRKGLDSPQTAGLCEWNEFPELGILGDLIASLDINNRASVLVIQQQINKHCS